MQVLPRINIEESMAKCVEAIGGLVLDRTLGGVRRFKNADYHFPSDQVVGELKILSEDTLQKEDFIRATSALYARWESQGKVKPAPPGENILSFSTVPPECRQEWLELLRKRLESSTISLANQQIRATKKHFGMPYAVGVLILANDGNFALKPTVLFYLLHHILKARFRSIDAVIFFTANEPLKLPGFGREGAGMWADLVVSGRRALPAGFAGRLSQEWMRHCSQQLSTPIITIQPKPMTPGEMDEVDFVNKWRQDGKQGSS